MPPKRTAAQVLDNLRNINEVLSGDDDSENDDERGISIDNDDDYILEENSSDTDTEDHVDLLEFFGILLSRGVFCQKMSIKCMWDSLYGINIVRRLMGRDKCFKLMRFLRFDDKSIRRVGLVSDKFVMIRALWERFIDNSNVCYIPGRDLTVDEQLLPCKSRCPFTQFMANKPDKFGIKFWLLCDVKSKYICNGYPYLGADYNKNPNDLVGESVVKKVMEPFL